MSERNKFELKKRFFSDFGRFCFVCIVSAFRVHLSNLVLKVAKGSFYSFER